MTSKRRAHRTIRRALAALPLAALAVGCGIPEAVGNECGEEARAYESLSKKFDEANMPQYLSYPTTNWWIQIIIMTRRSPSRVALAERPIFGGGAARHISHWISSAESGSTRVSGQFR